MPPPPVGKLSLLRHFNTCLPVNIDMPGMTDLEFCEIRATT